MSITDGRREQDGKGSSPNAVVLIVDDNPLMINVLRSLLTKEGYSVYVSENGEEALEVLGAKKIDLILCDVMMPRLDGYGLHSMVRAKAEFSHIPFVFLTALDEEIEIQRGTEAGVDDYLTKPFEPRSLLSIVKGKVIRSRHIRACSDERYDLYRRRIVHTLSHEFRTPLVAINTGTELLLEEGYCLDESKTLNLLEAIRRGGERLERLVNDFMSLQQIEAGVAERLFGQRASVQRARTVVDTFLEVHASHIAKEGGEISISDRSEDVMVRVYNVQFVDILWRLTTNAIKFSQPPRSVELHIYLQEQELVFEIRDRGIGIDIERIKEVIDPFVQLNRERLEQQGGGLGLAIANRYTILHGGRLEFDRRQGGGSIVSVVLPLARDPDPTHTLSG